MPSSVQKINSEYPLLWHRVGSRHLEGPTRGRGLREDERTRSRQEWREHLKDRDKLLPQLMSPIELANTVPGSLSPGPRDVSWSTSGHRPHTHLLVPGRRMERLKAYVRSLAFWA
jgi:hypothetical protein